MMKKHNKEKTKCARDSRKRQFVGALLFFILSLPVSWQGFVNPDTGEIIPLRILLCVLAWGVMAFLAYVPWEGFRGRELLWREVGLLLISLAGFCAFCIFSVGAFRLTPWYLVTNLLPVYILVRICCLIFHSLTTTALVSYVICGVLAAINFYVYQFRSRPLCPWDLYAVDTAAVVVKDYDIRIGIQVIAAYLLGVCLCLLMKFLPKMKKRSIKEAGMHVAVIAAAVLVYGYGIFPQFHTSIWDAVFHNAENGTVASFLAYLPWMTTEKPEGYDSRDAKAFLEEIGGTEADQEKTKAVNIIMIMDESMTDYAVFTSDYMEYMPFYHSLQENTIKGNLYVSCYGGNTCDTEFESLTGNSILYAPNIPFETQFHQPMPSIVSNLSDDGYEVLAMHPMGAKDWNRDKVYDYLGFQEFVTIDDLDDSQENYIRNNYSDASDFAWIIDRYEGKEQGTPWFLFNVTMQNHGGYGEETLNDNWQVSVDLSDLGDYPQAEMFLSLMQETDRAFEELVTYFSGVEEPTIICIYGDHQPDLQDDFLDLLYGESSGKRTGAERQKKYTTPFLIWANYDIEETYIERMSANYLGALVLQTANVDMDPYQTYLLDLFEKYPVITPYGIYDAAGQYFATDEEADSEEIAQYRKLQYYRMKEAY